MNLERSSHFRAHCEIVLCAGGRITLKSLQQKLTYGGVMIGRPESQINTHIIQRELNEARRFPLLCHATVIAPLRSDGSGVVLESTKWSGPRDGTSEWLPAVTCVGLFDGPPPASSPNVYGGMLKVVWFQDEYALPIDPEIHRSLEKLDWESLAQPLSED